MMSTLTSKTKPLYGVFFIATGIEVRGHIHLLPTCYTGFCVLVDSLPCLMPHWPPLCHTSRVSLYLALTDLRELYCA